MYIKLKNGKVKQIITCCEHMARMVMDGHTSMRGNQTLAYRGYECNYCPFCGAKVDVIEIY